MNFSISSTVLGTSTNNLHPSFVITTSSSILTPPTSLNSSIFYKKTIEIIQIIKIQLFPCSNNKPQMGHSSFFPVNNQQNSNQVQLLWPYFPPKLSLFSVYSNL